MGSFSLSGGVEVIGFISPTDPLDEYPVIDPLYGIDGFRNVDLLSDLDNIPELRRRAGMVVGVSGGTTYYKLNSSPWNFDFTDWSVFNTGGSVSGNYLPLSGGTVTGSTTFTSGLYSNIISATTYQNLPIDVRVTGGTYNNGTSTFTNNTGGTFNVVGFYTGSTDVFVTGGTYSNGVSTFTNNTGGTFNVVGLSTGTTINLSGGTGISVSGISPNFIIENTSPDQTVVLNNGSNISVIGTYPNFTIDVTGLTDNNTYTTGFTYNNNTFTISDNSGVTLSATFNTVTGLTVNGILSATTYQNLPQYYAGVISGSTNWINNNNGSITLPNLQVGLFSTPNFSGPLNLYGITSTTLVLNNEDTNYIGIDYNGGSPIYFLSNNDGLINDSDVILYLIIYRSNNFLHILEFGDYGSGLPNKLNDRVLMTDRFAHESGCILGLSGGTGIVTLTDGVVWNGVNREIISAVTSNDGVFFKNYHVGGNWVYTTTASTLNNQFYDNGTNLVSATTGNYLVNWYFRGQEVNDHLYEVFGNNEYVSVAAAELSLEPLLPELITSHAFIVGRIIVGVGQTTGLTQTAFVTPFVSTQVTNHNDLLGLQGGGPGEYYHLSSNEYNNLAYTNADNNFSVNQTINGDLIVSGNTSVDSLSATTLNVNGVNITGDTYVTGGTYYTGGTIIFGYNTVGNFPVTGLTEDLNNAIDGLAEADELTIELDVLTNKIRLKDIVAPGSGGTRTFQGDIVIESGLTATTAFITYTQWTLDFMDSLALEIYAPNDISIDSIIDLVNNPTATILVNNSPYTPATLITIGDKINVTTDINSVIQFNITNYL
jgi:hypothetical protein